MLVKKVTTILVLVCLLFVGNVALGKDDLPRLFLFLGGDEVMTHKSALAKPCVSGAQIVYPWRQLEPKKGVYNFSKIEEDLHFLSKINKKLFIQLQDRSFESTTFNVPDYLREDKIYHGGVAMQYDSPGEGKPLTSGWVARVWDPAVRERYQLLMKKLAAKFDGRIYGINLPETAVDFDEKQPPEGFTSDNYFYAELENIAVLRKEFHKSIAMQYVNFFPGEWNDDHHYMSRLFSYAMSHQIGLGGPDAVPYRMTHMENSYPFFHKDKGALIASIAIQEPDYTYKNPETGALYTFADFYGFTQNYLGAALLFWNVQEPFFSNQLAPMLNSQHF